MERRKFFTGGLAALLGTMSVRLVSQQPEKANGIEAKLDEVAAVYGLEVLRIGGTAIYPVYQMDGGVAGREIAYLLKIGTARMARIYDGGELGRPQMHPAASVASKVFPQERGWGHAAIEWNWFDRNLHGEAALVIEIERHIERVARELASI